MAKKQNEISYSENQTPKPRSAASTCLCHETYFFYWDYFQFYHSLFVPQAQARVSGQSLWIVANRIFSLCFVSLRLLECFGCTCWLFFVFTSSFALFPCRDTHRSRTVWVNWPNFFIFFFSLFCVYFNNKQWRWQRWRRRHPARMNGNHFQSISINRANGWF